MAVLTSIAVGAWDALTLGSTPSAAQLGINALNVPNTWTLGSAAAVGQPVPAWTGDRYIQCDRNLSAFPGLLIDALASIYAAGATDYAVQFGLQLIRGGVDPTHNDVINLAYGLVDGTLNLVAVNNAGKFGYSFSFDNFTGGTITAPSATGANAIFPIFDPGRVYQVTLRQTKAASGLMGIYINGMLVGEVARNTSGGTAANVQAILAALSSNGVIARVYLPIKTASDIADLVTAPDRTKEENFTDAWHRAPRVFAGTGGANRAGCDWTATTVGATVTPTSMDPGGGTMFNHRPVVTGAQGNTAALKERANVGAPIVDSNQWYTAYWPCFVGPSATTAEVFEWAIRNTADNADLLRIKTDASRLFKVGTTFLPMPAYRVDRAYGLGLNINSNDGRVNLFLHDRTADSFTGQKVWSCSIPGVTIAGSIGKREDKVTLGDGGLAELSSCPMISAPFRVALVDSWFGGGAVVSGGAGLKVHGGSRIGLVVPAGWDVTGVINAHKQYSVLPADAGVTFSLILAREGGDSSDFVKTDFPGLSYCYGWDHWYFAGWVNGIAGVAGGANNEALAQAHADRFAEMARGIMARQGTLKIVLPMEYPCMDANGIDCLRRIVAKVNSLVPRIQTADGAIRWANPASVVSLAAVFGAGPYGSNVDPGLHPADPLAYFQAGMRTLKTPAALLPDSRLSRLVR